MKILFNKHNLSKVTFLTLFCLVTHLTSAQDRVRFPNGQKLWINGTNVAWKNFGSDMGGGNPDLTAFGNEFKDVKQNGGNRVRLWLHADGWKTPSFNGDLCNGPGETSVEDLRKICDKALENNVTLMLCLWSFDMLQNSPYRTQPQMDRNYKMLTDDTYMNAYVNNALGPLVTGLKGHPAIQSWEIFNEAEAMTSNGQPWKDAGFAYYIPMVQVQKFVNRCAAKIHSVDPSALVTNGTKSLMTNTDTQIDEGWNWTEKNYYSDAQLRAAGGQANGTLDFYTIHYYDWMRDALFPFNKNSSFWALDKPLVIAEFFMNGYAGISNTDLYTTAFDRGYAGAMSWKYDEGDTRPKTNAAMSTIFASHRAAVEITTGGPTNTAPVASFTATPTSGTAPLAVAFNASASSDADGDALSYTWAFGDNTTGNGKTINHTYTAVGTYTAKLTVADGKGGSNSKSVTITVNGSGGGNTAPVANFTFTPATGVAPAKISFNASSSKDADGDVLTFKWNLGNGSYSAGRYMSYTYTTPGTYTVRLTVTDGKGGSNSKTANITITGSNGGGTSSLKVQYRAGNTMATDNAIQPQLLLVNTGTQAVPMSELKVRYWYTNEGGTAQTFFCDWATIGAANVQGRFVKLNTAVASADHYLEVGFTAAAGSLAANGNSGDIQTRFSKNDWSNYNETGDYSFSASQTAYADWTKVTLYRNGQLVWGIEPAGAARLGTASVETSTRLGVYPNPANNQLTLSYQALETGSAQVSLVNAKGEASIRESRLVEAGQNSIQLAVSHLQRGIYLVTIQQGNTKVVKKVSLQ